MKKEKTFNLEKPLEVALDRIRDLKDALNWLKNSGKPDWCRRMALEVVDDITDMIGDLIDRIDDLYPIYRQAMIENDKGRSRILWGDDDDFLDPFGGSSNE